MSFDLHYRSFPTRVDQFLELNQEVFKSVIDAYFYRIDL